MKRSVKSVIASAAAIFMCAAPAISSVPVLPVVESITASAAQYPVALDYMGKGYAANGLLYQFNGGNSVALIGRITNVSSINVPACVTINNYNYKVTTIAAEAFRVTAIDDHPDWFNEWHHYKYETSIHTLNMTDASNLTEIGDRAFQYQTLGTIKWPTNCKIATIGNEAFEGMGNVLEIKIPKSVTTIRANAFRWGALQKVTFEGTSSTNAALAIQSNAFRECLYLNQIVTNRKNLAGSNVNAFDYCGKTLKSHITSTVSSSYATTFKNTFHFAYPFYQ